jgi:hypothetical protein
MVKRWVLPGLLLMVMANGASSEDKWVYVNAGFLKMEKYVELQPGEQAVYAAGLVDGMYLAPVLGAPADDKSAVFSIHTCLKDMTNIQVAAIITKYAKDHPEKWHLGANVIGHQALTAVCPVK